MQLLQKPMKISTLNNIAKASFYNLVKAVVDLEQKIIAIDSPLHSDLESFLITNNHSHQTSLWGINLHPDAFGTDQFIEFDSMINLRPNQNNPSRNVLDPIVRSQIQTIVSQYFIQ